jgi:hypothetical protein
VTDPWGVDWYQIDITPEMRTKPVGAFNMNKRSLKPTVV